MSNVTTLPGVKAAITGAPNQGLISALKSALAMAESGELQGLIGVGFTASDDRYSIMCDTHESIYYTLGSLVWLQTEFQHRHPDGFQ